MVGSPVLIWSPAAVLARVFAARTLPIPFAAGMKLMDATDGVAKGDSPDFSGDYPQLVEAAGQLVHLFRDGLDYAFIPRCSRSE